MEITKEHLKQMIRAWEDILERRRNNYERGIEFAKGRLQTYKCLLDYKSLDPKELELKPINKEGENNDKSKTL